MRFAVRPGLQVGRFCIGQTLHSALKQLKEESNGRGSPLWRQVEVHSPTDPLQPVIVVGLLEDGTKWAITFDGVHHLALTVSVTMDAPVGGSAGRILQLQEEEGDFPRHPKGPKLLQTWAASRGRPESLSSRCSTTGLTVLEACTVEQANTSSSGAGFVSKVMCDGVILTLTHDTIPSSNLVVPPPFIPTSLQDLLPMDCYIIGIELVPWKSSPLLPLLCSSKTGKEKGAALSSPSQAVPYVHLALAGSDGRIVGICVKQQSPLAVPGSTHESHAAPYLGQRQVLFGDTMQAVLTELGSPESYYYRTYDNSEIFFPFPEGSAPLDQHVKCHRSDLFFNYFRLGVDVVFDAVSSAVKKFVLHASPPEAPDFESYSRCHFRIACSQGHLSTDSVAQVVFSPSHKWSQMASHLGTTCRLQKVVRHRELEFLGHRYATHIWYSALGQCMVEVLSNDVIASICILPDVVDDCTLPPVPSKDVSLCVQPRASQEEEEEEGCPSIPSSLPSTADEFEDARSSFQTPSSSLGPPPSQKEERPLPSFPNVNVVLRVAQGNTIQLTQDKLEGESDLAVNEDEVVVVPCFTDVEESDESDSEEEAANADEEGDVVDPDAAHESISKGEDAEASLTSGFDVISSLRNDTEVAAEEPTSSNPSTTMCDDPIEGDQLVTEPKKVLYKPGGSAGKASRLQDIIDSSQSSSGSKWEAKGGRTSVAGAAGGHAGEMLKNDSGKQGKRSKYELSERETKRLQRLCKPTATSLQRHAKAAQVAPPTAESEQQQDESEMVESDEQTTTRDLADVAEEEEEEMGGAMEKNKTAPEVEDENEDDADTSPLDLFTGPVLHPDARVSQFRTATFDRLFPAEPPKEDPKPVPKAASSSMQQFEENESFPTAGPELSLGSFQDALLKQFDIIKDSSTSGSGPSTVNDGSHGASSSCHGASGGSHGGRPTAGVDSSRRQYEGMGSEEGASAGTACPSGHCCEETVAAPSLPVCASPDETPNSPSSITDDKAAVTSPCSDIPDDVGDVNRHSDMQPDSPPLEDEVALETLQKGRWMEGSQCVVPRALYQDKEEQLLSLNSSFIEDLTADAVDMAARLHHRSKVMPEYLSCLLMSPWRGELPSPPCQLEGEEEQVLFVSALEVLLENKENFFTLERCMSLLPRLNTLLNEVALIQGKDHFCSVVCEVIEAVAMANMAILDQYKAGLLKTSNKDHYKCQLCYGRFERLAETMEALCKELAPLAVSEGKSTGNLPMVETARCAVNKILRQVEIHPEGMVDLET